jgi:SAM-dependent methyltransferase
MSFGARAGLYDRNRPGLPPAAVRDIIGYLPTRDGAPTLEIGAGTGQATAVLAKHGLRIDCLEPSRRMSAVLRMNCESFSDVRIYTVGFERWRPRRKYSLLIAAQSWHLIDPKIRLQKAAYVLQDGGAIALLWHDLPRPEDVTVRETLGEVTHRFGLGGESGPGDAGREGESRPLLYRSDQFTDAHARVYTRSVSVTLSRYLDLLSTYPDFMKTPHKRRIEFAQYLERYVFTARALRTSVTTVLHLARRTHVVSELDGQR